MKVLLTAVSLSFACAGTAYADCAPVVAAWNKADATRRFALFEVDSIAQASKGDPFMIVIGDSRYVPNMVRKGPLEIVADGYKVGGYTAGFEAKSLQDDERKGKKRCEALGERQVAGEASVGYRVRNNDKGNHSDELATDVWVSRASGLPLWSAIGADGGGLRWVYGKAVMEPPPAKIRK